MVRPYAAADRRAVDAILAAAYADDAVLRGLSSIHSEERGTLVAEEDGEVVGVATLFGNNRHPTRLFLAGAVVPARRGCGIGSALLDELRRRSDGRPLLVRVRRLDDGGARFLARNGFGLLMRNVTVTVDPKAVELPVDVPLESPSSPDELASAHERAYRRQHESWAPVSERPLEESLRLFCGPSLLASALAPRGVASLHGAPFVDADDELALIAGAEDDATARTLLGYALAYARRAGKLLSVEADEADPPFWHLVHALPVLRKQQLFLLSTDVTIPPAGT